MKFLTKLLTKNLKEIPLLTINLNYKDFKKGIKNNCVIKCHPIFKDDKELQDKCKKTIDYIREKYNMGDVI